MIGGLFASFGREARLQAAAGGAAKAMGDPRRARLRLLVVCDRPSASQEVHLFRPLRRLARQGALALWAASEQSLTAAGGVAWFDRAVEDFRPQGLIFSRFGGGEAGGLLETARAARIPVLTHLDDFLLGVPPDLGADKVRHHNRPERIAAIRRTLEEADRLYVSTRSLAAALTAAGVATPMTVADLQSCADPEELADPAPPGSLVRIGYQGTRNHRLDLEMVMPAICRVLDERPDTTFELFGSIEAPAEFARFGDRVTSRNAMGDYDAFLTALKALRWDIGLAPLRATDFNSYRTYTKWTEYTVGGAVTLASAGVVYENVIGADAGVMVDEDGWAGALLRLVDDAALRRELIDAAQYRVRRCLTLAALQHQVLSVLRATGIQV